jgi:hypothetical protein
VRVKWGWLSEPIPHAAKRREESRKAETSLIFSFGGLC